MKTLISDRMLAVFVSILFLGAVSAQAADVLLNGGLEIGAGPQNWILTQTVSPSPPNGDYNNNGVTDASDYVEWRKNNGTSNALPNDNGLGIPIGPGHYDLWRSNFGNTLAPGPVVPASEQVDAAQEPPGDGLGLLLKPYAGNQFEFNGDNLPVDVTLSQTVAVGPGAPGHTYTFSADSVFQSAYSGNIDTLFPDAPSGPIPSPTQTKLEIDFLTSSNVLLSSATVDLPKHRTDSVPPTWVTTSVAAIAPAQTFNIRVKMSATKMLASCTSACPGGQDVYFDNFKLRSSTASATELLSNANIDTVGAPANWTLTTVGNDAVQFSSADFAVHSGNVGMWLRAFQGQNTNNPPDNPGPIDAVISQVVPATAGASYTFSAWAKLQEAYSGLDPSSGTKTFIKMEFLNNQGATIGDPVNLELSTLTWDPGPDNGQGAWQQVSLPTTLAPNGTTSIRVSGGATGMISEVQRFPNLAESAMFDDFSLIMGSPGNGSGNLLKGALAASSVPEPSTLLLATIALFGGLHKRRGSKRQ